MKRYTFGDPAASNILVQMVDDHDLSVIESEVSLIREFAGPDFFLIALKVDGVHHIITLMVFVAVCLIFGIPDLSLIVLLICILAALSDEIGHETISKVTDNQFINLFFEYRFVMKIVIFLLVIFGAFDVLVFICFILFEVAYEMAGIVFEKLN